MVPGPFNNEVLRFQGQEESEYLENLSLSRFPRVTYFIFANK